MVVPPAVQARVDSSSEWSGSGKARSVQATADKPIAVVRAPDYKRYWAPSSAPQANRYADDVRAVPDDAGAVTGGGPIQAASEPNGFHWRDGLLGAIAALGIALLAFAALLGTQRRRAATA
jgi:hypothetical protein